MIIKGILDIIYNIFSALTLAINLPSLPDGVRDVLSATVEYIATGISILSNFCDINYLLVLFGVIVAVELGMYVYKIILWVLKKIPMVGIE